MVHAEVWTQHRKQDRLVWVARYRRALEAGSTLVALVSGPDGVRVSAILRGSSAVPRSPLGLASIARVMSAGSECQEIVQ